MTEFDSKYIVGIDEVGRGPLAGPVAIGIVSMEMGEYKKLLAENIFVAGKDSKKLSPKKRLENFSVIKKLGDEKRLEWGVFFEDNQIIDKYGIVGALNMAIAKGCRSLSCLPEQAHFLLDGGLKARWNSLIKSRLFAETSQNW